jgi:hypothetical protein
MPSYGSIICCPACDTRHVVKVGEINAHQQIVFFCSHCGWRVSMEHDGSRAMAVRPLAREDLRPPDQRPAPDRSIYFKVSAVD